MAGAARERLAELLGGVEGGGVSSARSTLPVDSLYLEVRGVGELRYPVPQAQARQLCAIARPARYGQGEDTLLDRRVRDTWEVPRSRVKIDKRRWHAALRLALDRLRRDLRLPEGCELKAELHSMLVYGPGQFFVPHQDSERDDDMVGSLVVTLPSSFTGGDLVVHGGAGTKRYRGSKSALSLVGFYADCRHEIRPVRSGFRIVLTYNLLLRGEPDTSSTEVDASTVDVAVSRLDEHFATPVERRWRSGPPEGPPSRLVYLLDHEYTRRGLGWPRLKGGDAPRAAVLRAAAERGGCEAVLALADVHETWSAFEPDEFWGRGSRHRRWDLDDGPDDGDGRFDDGASLDPATPAGLDKYELDEVIDSDVMLDSWTGPEGGPAQPVASSVDEAEVCATTPSAELVPYAAEYEGYMGNYGNTLDRWYHRGAVIVWPRHLAFRVRAEAAPTAAVIELVQLLADRQGDRACDHVRSIEPIWADTVRGTTPEPGLVGTALVAGAALDDADLAALLVGPFPLTALGPEHTDAVVDLADTYGTAWMNDLVDRWSATGPRLGRAAEHLSWTASLPRLCEPLATAGATGVSVACQVNRRGWDRLRPTVEQRRALTPPSLAQDALAEVAAPLLGLLAATGITGDTRLRDELTGYLTADAGDDDLLGCAMTILRDAPDDDPRPREATGLDRLAEHCRTRLDTQVRRPPRADDDWSLRLPSGCDCELCATLDEFLARPTRRVFEWPIAKAKRQHVHRRIDDAGLPVAHQTRRTGSPYTLVLTKTDELFTREAEGRRQAEDDLAWLNASGIVG